MKIAFDIESTGINPYTAEIIEMYLLKEDGDGYLFQSQVDRWSDEAESVHGISQAEMLTYPNKKEAFDNLINWLPDKFELICFSNANTQLGYLLYDIVLLKYQLMLYLDVDRENNLPFKISSFSVHSLAKECEALNLFKAYRDPKTNRKSFKQDNVYYALFGKYPENSHRAINDVLTLVKIYDKLIKIKTSGESISNSIQMSLI